MSAPASRGSTTRAAARRRLGAFTAALAALAAVGVGAGACSDATTDPNAPVSISFDSLPAPVIVLGDTLRNPETGAAVPLVAHAYNGNGQEIANPAFTFFARDTGNALVVEEGNYLVARKLRSAAVQVFASLNGLQLSRTIQIVRRPDSLALGADSVPRLTLRVPDDYTNTDTLRVKVLHVPTEADVAADTSDKTVSGVQGWVVRFAIDSGGERLADSLRLVATATSTATGAAMPTDTTDASGLASRLLRVFAKEGTPVGTLDTVYVTATSQHRGTPLRGSPIRFVLVLAH